MAQTIIDRNSANGTAIQIPFTPLINGSNNNPDNTNINVRSNEIIAETFPFDSAVNNIEQKMFNPMNKKLIQNIRNPSIDMLYTSLHSSTINWIEIGPSKRDNANITMELMPIKAYYP